MSSPGKTRRYIRKNLIVTLLVLPGPYSQHGGFPPIAKTFLNKVTTYSPTAVNDASVEPRTETSERSRLTLKTDRSPVVIASASLAHGLCRLQSTTRLTRVLSSLAPTLAKSRPLLEVAKLRNIRTVMGHLPNSLTQARSPTVLLSSFALLVDLPSDPRRSTVDEKSVSSRRLLTTQSPSLGASLYLLLAR